jgi:hypothetical protein
MNSRVPYVAFALAAGLFVGTVTQSSAQGFTPPNTDITFKLCGGSQKLTFKQPPGTDKLEIYCPGNPKPVLTVQGCIGPHVKRLGTDYTLKCDRWVEYTPGVPVVK